MFKGTNKIPDIIEDTNGTSAATEPPPGSAEAIRTGGTEAYSTMMSLIEYVLENTQNVRDVLQTAGALQVLQNFAAWAIPLGGLGGLFTRKSMTRKAAKAFKFVLSILYRNKLAWL